MNDRIKIKGYVNVYQHEDDEEYKDGEMIVDKKSNKFTNAILEHLQALMSIKQFSNDSWEYDFAGGGTYQWDIYLGTDTTTSTSAGDTALQSPIGTAPGTPPDNKYGEGIVQVSIGIWESKFIGTWYSGTVSGTVGEIGLYLFLGSNDTFEKAYLINTTFGSKKLSNRLSVVDGEFSSFTINESKSLTVEWVMRYEFE